MSPQHHAYESTTVPEATTQGEIRKLLMANGARGYQQSEFLAEGIVEVKWAREIKVDGRPVFQPLRVRVSVKGKRPATVWRAVYWHLKAKFEIVQFGILSFEEEFLPYFEMRLPDGRIGTVAELMVPNLKRALPPPILDAMRALPPGEEVER